MRYPKLLAYNAAGGVAWGVGFVLLGYFAGNSYQRVEKTVGRDAAVVTASLAVIAFIVWRLRHGRRERDGGT